MGGVAVAGGVAGVSADGRPLPTPAAVKWKARAARVSAAAALAPQRLQHAANAPVQVAPPAGRRVGVQRLADQRMREAVGSARRARWRSWSIPAPGGRRRPSGARGRPGPLLRPAPGGLHHRQVPLLADDGRDLEQASASRQAGRRAARRPAGERPVRRRPSRQTAAPAGQRRPAPIRRSARSRSNSTMKKGLPSERSCRWAASQGCTGRTAPRPGAPRRPSSAPHPEALARRSRWSRGSDASERVPLRAPPPGDRSASTASGVVREVARDEPEQLERVSVGPVQVVQQQDQ